MKERKSFPRERERERERGNFFVIWVLKRNERDTVIELVTQRTY